MRGIPDLSSLLAPVAVDRLTTAIRAAERLFVRTADAARFGGVLPWSTINELFRANRFEPGQVAMRRGTTELLPSMYVDSVDSTRLDLRSVQSLVDQGVSVVIHSVDRNVQSVADLCSMFERHLGSQVWANCYLTFRKDGAFGLHFDAHDVVVLHLHGRKRWHCFGRPERYPMSGRVFDREAVPGPAAWEEVLEPGDILYLPRGEIHRAAVEGEVAVHLTLGVRPGRGADVLAWAAGLDDLEEVIRMDVSRVAGPHELERHEVRLKEAFHRLIDRIRLADFLDQEDARRRRAPRVDLGPGAPVGPGTRVRPAYLRRVELPVPQDGFVTFRVDGRTHRVTAPAAELLDLVQDSESITLAEAGSLLPAIELETLRQAARELARSRLVDLEAEDD
jgi:hypothetical protein